MAFIRQFGILMTKQFLLAIRNWKSSLVQILAPIVICFILFGFQKLADTVLNSNVEFQETRHLGVVPPCLERNGLPCTTLFFMPAVPWVQSIMESVSRQNNWKFGTDVVPFAVNRSLFALDYLEMMEYFGDHQNQTQNAVVFLSAYQSPTQMPSDPGYILFYNYSQYGYTPELVKCLNQAIYEIKANISIPDFSFPTGKPQAEVNFLDILRRDYPYKFRISTYDVVASNGATWFFLPPMITFFIVLTEIVQEKEKRLRLGMRMMGLSNSAYWTTWWLTGVIYTCLSAIVLILTGVAFQFAFFTNSFPIATFALFFFFGVAMTSFAMFISVFLNSSGTAQTVGYAFILVGFVFQIVLSSGNGLLIDLMWTQGVEDWVVGLRWGLTWYPPFNMAKVFTDIAAKAADTLDPIGGRVVKGAGFGWDDLWSRKTIDYSEIGIFMDIPSPAETFGWFCVSAASYLLLMWYFDNVLPGEHGSPRPLHFFILDLHKNIKWLFSGCKSRDINSHKTSTNSLTIQQQNIGDEVDQDISAENARAYDAATDYPLRVCGMYKIYKHNLIFASKQDVIAVSNLSLVGAQDEILCLLGHNGAGKTTLVNILTGLFPPSAGQASIYGMDAVSEVDEIRQVLGVCPQHDILWSDLTAREHLTLFAKLKGLTDIDNQVADILSQVKLSHVGDNPVGSFSGGMKRRLSIGIATIGNPKIIFMDEPTTGLDPVNKRRVWGMIQSLKKNRVIVLTTHSMEEADILSDKVAIMAFGSLKCVGSALHLKTKYGKGYRVHISTKEANVKQVLSTLTSKIPKLKLEESEAGNLQFTISREHQNAIPTLLSYLEENPEGLVNEWGLGHATLEEVFLRVTKESNFGFDKNSNNNVELTKSGKQDESLPDQEFEESVKSTLEESQDIFAEPGTSSERVQFSDDHATYPLRALFRKNLTLQKRQTCTNVCQILTPVLVILIMLILQLIIKGQIGDDFNKKILVETYPFPLNSPYSFEDFADNFQNIFFPKKYPDHVGDWRHDQCLEFFFFVDETGSSSSILGNLSDSWPNFRNYSTFFGNIPQDRCDVNNTNGTNASAIPYVLQRSSDRAVQSEVYNLLDEYNLTPLSDVNELPTRNLMPDGYIIFSAINETSNYMKVTLSSNSLGILNYHRSNNFSRSGFHFPKNFTNNPGFQQFQLLINEGFTQLVDLVSRAWFNYTLNKMLAPPLTVMPNSLDSARFMQAIPYEQSPAIMNIVEGFGSFLFPLALSMQLPVYAFLLVLEKKEKLREMMKSHGMVTWHYYLVNCLFFFILYALAVAFFWLSGIAVEIRFFCQTHWSTLLTFFLGWGLSLISLAFVVSAFLNDPRAATVVGYAVAMIGTLIAIGICVGIYGPFSFSNHSQLPQSTFIWPQMSFVRGMFLMNYACAAQFSCYGPITNLAISDEIVQCIIALYLTSVIYWILFLYLDSVLPREYGIPKHPLFFLLPIWNLFCGRSASAETEIDEEKPLMREDQDDADVSRVRSDVKNGNFDVKTDPLVLNSLRKVFPGNPPKVAVKSLCLVVNQNSIFGLLGENGAGKTTTISMLTGLFPPSSGTAFVGGFDITKDIDKVHLVMGLCPQFDVLWEDLTAKEHLLFYARLKGIPPNQEDAHVNQVLNSVGLYQARDRMSMKLSGGMRRRLSLAISLVGSSRITFLDEPSTGLDPSTRRHIWTIIANAKKNRAIVLTTHSMDEAETLCNDIGILAHGSLKCLGSPQHLRSTHGEGYLLSVSYIPDSNNTAEHFIMKNFPMVVRVSKYNRNMEFRIPPKTLAISELFAFMESNTGGQNCIVDWAVTQLGLDSIFQSIVMRSNRENFSSNVENIGFEDQEYRNNADNNLVGLDEQEKPRKSDRDTPLV